MDNLKQQFLGFINTSALFQEIDGLQQFTFNNEEIKDFDFTQLEITKNLALGKRVECFFEFYIKQSNNYQLIKNNIQIIENKCTLGELDFIIYDKKEHKYIHIEHVYKFYLYDDTIPNEIDRYIGPNKNDTFVKKLTKLKNKQLPLLYKDESKQYISDIPSSSFEQKVCFKGQVYLPFGLEKYDGTLVNDTCISGFYIKHDDFVGEKMFQKYEYFLPEKFDWVRDASTNDIWYSFGDVIDTIESLLNEQKSPLVWLRDVQNNTTKSFFVVWW